MTTTTGPAAALIAEPWARDERYATLAGRLEHQDELDARMNVDTDARQFEATAAQSVRRVCRCRWSLPEDRIDHDAAPSTSGCGRSTTRQWATSASTASRPPLGDRLVDRARRRRCLGQHTDYVLRDVLGLDAAEIATSARRGV